MRIAVTLVTLGLLAIVVREGYRYSWTGFAGYQAPQVGAIPAKTLWDWLDLLIVPLVLAVGAFLLDGSRKRSEQEIESDRQRQHVLDGYFTYVSDLLLNGHLFGKSSSAHARELARTRTLAALRLLDGKRKAQLLQFLYEARLIDAEPAVQLNGADLTGALLDEATLSGAELRGVYFAGASIQCANLTQADLRGSDFSSVDFSDTDLSGARLAQARLCRANFKRATLRDADLTDTDLRNVRLTNEQRRHLSAS